MPPARLGVAVSGGGDSLALLHLVRDWAAGAGVPVAAVTVDHGLRPDAAQEAAFVAGTCARLGVPHDILKWSDWKGQGNLQDQARRARYALMTDWARARGIDAVALGHTADDQAETFVMRLARGSGVDGLSGMAGDHHAHGVRWLRPLLGQRRGVLRSYLTGIGQRWIDDPSNEDPAYDRVRARRALAVLDGLGITADGLADTCMRLSLAREALERLARDVAQAAAATDRGDVVLQCGALLNAPRETQLRLVAHALCWVASAEYRPRLGALTENYAQVLAGASRSLHGCLMIPSHGQIRITREYSAVRDTTCAPDVLWDRRWRLSGPPDKGLELRALGQAGLRVCPAWRGTGLPRASLLATPAVWRGDELVAAPLAGLANGWRAELAQGTQSFAETLISH
ncbi:tRNA lysidine(34) synthetase TilS [Actibacterium sp. D379-3]